MSHDALAWRRPAGRRTRPPPGTTGPLSTARPEPRPRPRRRPGTD